MSIIRIKSLQVIGVTATALILLVGSSPAACEDSVELKNLLPDMDAWAQTEDPQTFFPETLFEYINGAAEIYLSYDFHQLIVAQYQKGEAEDTLAVEIYDMGGNRNSFGIYSAERYPENAFVDIGVEGYLEEGSLNFMVGRYYVKLLCFDCGEASNKVLRSFAAEITKRAGDKGAFPDVLQIFPEDGRLPHTEKYIMQNFMGYSFLHDGYLVNYQHSELEFDAFLIEGKSKDEASEMLERYLEAKGKENVEKFQGGYHIKDRYYHNIFIAPVDNILCGVMKIKEGSEDLGKKYLSQMVANLKAR